MRDEVSPPITARLLLEAYGSGIFPMAEHADATEIFWVDPKLRGVLPLEGLHVSRSLRKKIRQGGFSVRINRCFIDVVHACAEREETWINTQILALYNDLHRTGYAHSVEVWEDDALIGGLYGVALGGAFFGESMFSRAPDASKIALVYLVARLRVGGFRLLDTQFVTDHLARLGAVEVTRATYHALLDDALRAPADFWRMPADAEAQSVLQASTQTS